MSACGVVGYSLEIEHEREEIFKTDKAVRERSSLGITVRELRTGRNGTAVLASLAYLLEKGMIGSDGVATFDQMHDERRIFSVLGTALNK